MNYVLKDSNGKRKFVSKFVFDVHQAKNYQLKQWVKRLLKKVDYRSEKEILESVDWRDNDCLREILISYEYLSKEVIG